MALVLTLNGVTTTTIPGSPANGDKISMHNGVVRLSFTYNTHSGAQWCVDQFEYSSNGGTTWTLVIYGRDEPHVVIKGTEYSVTNAALSILVNTATTLQLQLQGTQLAGGVTYTLTSTWKMTTATSAIECSQYVAANAQVALTAGQFLEDWGPVSFSAGIASNTAALYHGYVSPYDNNRCKHLLYTAQNPCSRQIIKGGNSSGRGYTGGYGLLLASGVLCSFVISPASYRNLLLNIVDATNASQRAALDAVYACKGYDQYYKTIDNAWRNQHDLNPTYFRMATCFGDYGNATTFPQATSVTDPTTTLNLTWSLAIEQPVTTAVGSGSNNLPLPRWMIPQAMNKWMDALYPRPNVGEASPVWQSLATQEATVLPVLKSTFTTYFETVYGYWLHTGANNQRESYVAAQALRLTTRYLKYGVGTTDAQAMADLCAKILANYQTTTGNQTGAIQKIRNTTTNKFLCEENNHQANADQPHVSMYVMAEALHALIDYYKVRGNQTLTATYGNVTVAAVLDLAMAYLATVQQKDGGWLVECNNVNTATATNAHIGASYSGAATPDLAASLYYWSLNSPTATAAQKAQWQSVAMHAINYWLESESTPHGAYEFGEDHVNYTAHAIELAVRGLLRYYRLTGSARCLEHALYYFEIGILMCKRVDDVINNTGTANQNVHTGGLISTIDWNGVITGEAGCIWHILLTDALAYHPQLLSVHYFYLWAALMQQTWGYRDQATYSTSTYTAQAYLTPGTGFAGYATGVDNTRFLKHATCAALHLLPTQTMIASSNAAILATCLEAGALDTYAGRTILLYNPQSSAQTVTLTIHGMANKAATQDGTTITSTTSGSDLSVTLTLSAGQISRVSVR